MTRILLFAGGLPAAVLCASWLRPGGARVKLTPPRTPVVMLAEVTAGDPDPAEALTSAHAEAYSFVAGQLVDTSGKPVPHASVVARDASASPLGSAESDDGGRFRVGVSATRAAAVYLDARAGALRGAGGPFDADAGGRVAVVMGAPVTVRGTVVDDRGDPVEGAFVDARRTGLSDEAVATLASEAARTRSDARGQFALAVPTPDTWTLTVVRGGYGTNSRNLALLAGPVVGVTLEVDREIDADVPLIDGETAESSDFGPALELAYADPSASAGGDLIVQEPMVRSTAGIVLLRGDRVVKVAGIAVSEGSPWQRLRGPAGTRVEIEVIRPTTGERFTVQLPRVEPMESEGC
jgi:hypothetical protein